jgi:hypothetical protein
VSARARQIPRRRRLFLDTSAYLSILLAEEGWEEIADETNGAELLASVVLILEAKRNLVRLARDRVLMPDQYKVCIDRVDRDVRFMVLRDLTFDLCRSSVLPAVATPRSLDLAHLRTALWFHALEPIDRFVTTDIAQERAASELGLPT